MIQLFNMLDPFENHEGAVLETNSEGLIKSCEPTKLNSIFIKYVALGCGTVES